MKNKLLIFASVLSFCNLFAQAEQRRLVIDNPAERGVFMARSIETEETIITEGYWKVLPIEKDSFTIPAEGQIATRVNFDGEREPINPNSIARCGSLTEKFKSIVKKTGEPRITLFMGEGNLDGYSTKKEGKDCKAVGGDELFGFHEAVLCDPNIPGTLCLPFAIVDNQSSLSMYVGACNLTSLEGVYVAVKFFENNEWRSQGWWEVERNNCRKVGPFPTDKPVYVLAMNSSEEPTLREWTPPSEKVRGCINPETGFLYAEKSDGACEAREAIPETAAAPEKTSFGKLVDAGYHGVAVFNILP